MHTINPILVLAGSTARVGNRMFADALINCDTGIEGVCAVLSATPRYAGMTPVIVAQCVDDTVKRDAAPCVVQQVQYPI